MRKWIGFAALIVGAIAAVRFIDLEASGKQPVPAASRDPFPFPRATQFPRSNGLIDVRAIYELAVTYCGSTPVAKVAEEFQTELTEEAAATGYAEFQDPESDGTLFLAARAGCRDGFRLAARQSNQ
jgi:hypothetical protein